MNEESAKTSDHPKRSRIRWRRIAWAFVAMFAAYVMSYALGTFSEFEEPPIHWRFHYFGFNPWMYIPIANCECWFSRPGTIVILGQLDGSSRVVGKFTIHR
jgi:hypothetical protein